MSNLYYREDLTASDFTVGATVEVVGDEARHALRAARLRVGEHTLIGDSRGTLGAGEVVSADRDRFTVRLSQVETRELPITELVLVQALAKGDRDERAVEQATEFGVDRIVPWQAARSVSRWVGGASGAADKQSKGVAKWARIAREAAKQSLRAHVPTVADPLLLNGLCELARRPESAVLVLHPRGSRTLSSWAREQDFQLQHPARAVHVVVGPEGGLDDRELDSLADAGAHVLLLGHTVLRTSSAGPAALAVLNVALGRW